MYHHLIMRFYSSTSGYAMRVRAICSLESCYCWRCVPISKGPSAKCQRAQNASWLPAEVARTPPVTAAARPLTTAVFIVHVRIPGQLNDIIIPFVSRKLVRRTLTVISTMALNFKPFYLSLKT